MCVTGCVTYTGSGGVAYVVYNIYGYIVFEAKATVQSPGD